MRPRPSSNRPPPRPAGEAGWPWAVARPGLPQIRTCAIDASGSSDHGFAAQRHPGMLSVSISLTRLRTSVHPTCFLPTVPRPDVPLPSTGSSRAEFPCFVGTIRTLRLPAVPPAALRFLRLAVPLTDACGFAATGGKRQTPVSRGTLITRFAPISRGFVRKRQGLPRSWGTPIVPMPCSSTPAGPITPGPSRCVGTAPVQTPTRAPAGTVSRGSITRPGHSRSTLRRVDYSTPTQDSLPAAGQALPDGLATRRVPTKGFRAISYMTHPPFPSFVAQGA